MPPILKLNSIDGTREIAKKKEEEKNNVKEATKKKRKIWKKAEWEKDESKYIYTTLQ